MFPPTSNSDSDTSTVAGSITRGCTALSPEELSTQTRRKSARRHFALDVRIRLVAWNTYWWMCVDMKTNKGYRTRKYSQVSIPIVSITVLGLDSADNFALFNASTNMKVSDSAVLRTLAGILPKTSTSSFSSVVLPVVKEWVAQTWWWMPAQD